MILMAKRWEVVRITLRGDHGQVLGRYRWLWVAKLHHAWANIGLRVAKIRRVEQ
jgi:hypothetical protein